MTRMGWAKKSFMQHEIDTSGKCSAHQAYPFLSKLDKLDSIDVISGKSFREVPIASGSTILFQFRIRSLVNGVSILMFVKKTHINVCGIYVHSVQNREFIAAESYDCNITHPGMNFVSKKLCPLKRQQQQQQRQQRDQWTKTAIKVVIRKWFCVVCI